MFCGCFAVFCECFAVFPQNTQNTRKTSKNTEKQKKLTIRSCIAGVFQEQKNRLYCTKHLSQNICKTPQNTTKHRKTDKTRFVKLRRKTLQNTRKTLVVTKRSQYSRNTYCAHSVISLSPKIRYICRESTKYAIYTRKLRGGSRTRRGSRSRIVDVFQKQCFAVFCGVLRCFAVFCVRVFSVFHKTAQNRPKSIQNAQNEQNTLCAIPIQRNTVLRIFLSLRKCLQKTFAKHVQNIAKHPQNAKHCCFSKNTRKTPLNTRTTPAKHRKTPQNTFANKTDRIS